MFSKKITKQNSGGKPSNGVRLLICTQKVDKNDSVLGFFHQWLEVFAGKFEQISVICLYEGEHNLPVNVQVYSLGKESGVSRLKYIVRFYQYAWNLRSQYDSVFVHMNQEYVLMGWKLWWLLRKPVFMWRNHYAGSWLTRVAVAACKKVFCTSKHSYTAKFKKCVLMPVGVDTEVFMPVPTVVRVPHSILSLGRISPSKNIHVLIDALHQLSDRQVDFTCDIYGGALPDDAQYLNDLKQRVSDFGLSERIRFHGAIKNTDTPAVYSAHKIFVNASRSGMFDKTLFEAMACGCEVLASSEDLTELVGKDSYFEAGDSSALATALESHLSTESQSRGLYSHIVSNNSLRTLVTKLMSQMS